MTENMDNAAEEIVDLMAEISEGVWYAGWLDDIESRVFDMVRDPAPYLEMPMSITPKEAKKLLGRLVRMTLEEGWWPQIDYGTHEFIRVPVDRLKNEKNISDAKYEKMLAYWARY